jgi:hypothetical protein
MITEIGEKGGTTATALFAIALLAFLYTISPANAMTEVVLAVEMSRLTLISWRI